ncbi:MAG: BatA domain-containing protein [Bacteroidota bacterium]
MIFLNPTILFGLLAASIPVILHFLNLRKIRKIEFSTLAFLKELQKSKIKRIKFKQWLLLALRILIILFLVSSFARPTLETVAISGTGSVAKTTAVIILDDSYSMSIVDENGSYLNQAKEIIIDLISDFNEGDEVIIILTSAPDNKILSSNFNQLIKDIRGIKISYITNSLSESLSAASLLINNASNYNKEVFVFSDFQKSTTIEQKDDEADKIISFDETTKLYLFRFENGEVQNIAVNDLKSLNQIFELNKEITLQASVTNFSDDDFDDALLSIFLNGEINAHQNVSIPLGTTKMLSYNTILKKSGTVELLAELEDDEIEYDNRYYHTINVPENINVLISSNSKIDSKFIELALRTSSENIFKIEKIKSREINSVNLDSYDCLFLIGLKDNINTTKLTQFVKEGGQIIIAPSSNMNNQKFNSLLEAFNIPRFGNLQTLIREDQFNTFEKINYQHPIFNNIFEKENNQNIESPHIRTYYKTSLQGEGESIISLLDGSSFLSEYHYEDGKIFLFNIAPTLSWSDFPIKSIFVPIINRSIYYLTSNKNNFTSLIAGDKIEIDISNINIPQIKVLRPDKSEEFANIDPNSKYFKYKNSDLIGLYKFYSGDKLIDVAAVNVNIIESNLKTISLNDFENYLNDAGFKGTILHMDNKNYKNEISQARFGSELWKLFLIITLILALIEMFIARSAKKDLADLTS